MQHRVQPTGHENIGAGIVVLLEFCTITPCTIVCHLVCLCCAWCAAPRERELVSDKKDVLILLQPSVALNACCGVHEQGKVTYLSKTH
ncbi:hypothetical protein ANCCAN_00413 [Ancylostoma caninum]|uniref:Uncharacterized protein n=1 Tax=Ancylostoma caninum TaxID=29170 RepID=A0A368HD67_ANCCA|nr:hypothetical protein ANCCAN_00413 [Ancylostoma caninum]